VVHGTAAALALDSAFGVATDIPDNGRILRNMILASNYLQSHILHFYILAALDYVDVTAAAQYEGDSRALNTLRDFIAGGELSPFAPRFEGDYRLDAKANLQMTAGYAEALSVRRICHEMLAVFGGKMPHEVAIVPGGVCERPTVDKILAFRSRLGEISNFIDDHYLPDLLTIAGAYEDHFGFGKGVGRYLSYGVFDQDVSEADLLKRPRLLPGGIWDGKVKAVDASQITESVRHSHFDDAYGGKHPSEEDTVEAPDKEGAYSWAKSPRLGGEPYEVGPLARCLVAYHKGDKKVKQLVDGALSAVGADLSALESTAGRHLARALEAKLLVGAMDEWSLQLDPAGEVCVPSQTPEEGAGAGLVDGPRGALGHWIRIADSKIARYQLVVPTTWNVSPRDEKEVPGPIEQALMGTRVRDENNPFEVVRIARSFDPCLACAVHIMTPKGKLLGECRIV
jgi:hydrogenase large subunit